VAEVIALLALFEGRLDEAEALIERAHDLGRRAETTQARVVHGLQQYALRREQGRAAEMEAPLAELMRDYWFYPWVRAAAVHLQAELGRTAEAQREFDACAAAGFEDWPLDNAWLLGLSLFADVCTFLGDSQRRPQRVRASGVQHRLRRPITGKPEVHDGSLRRRRTALHGRTRSECSNRRPTVGRPYPP
jgi:hypothetical protein